MRREIYKVALALLGYKLIDLDKYFLFTYDITMKQFVYWYIKDDYTVRVLSSVKSPLEAKFKWLILVKRGKSHVNS